MSRVPLPELPGRVPDSESERRLTALRREAAQTGMVLRKRSVAGRSAIPASLTYYRLLRSAAAQRAAVEAGSAAVFFCRRRGGSFSGNRQHGKLAGRRSRTGAQRALDSRRRWSFVIGAV